MASTPTGSPEVVKETWMPTVAGILSIIAGVVELFFGAIIGAVGAVLTTFIKMPGLGAIIGFPLIVLGIAAVVGGVFSIKRRVWGLALAGAICSVFLPHVTVLGILAIIFIAISKREFK
jgi:ABC-type xylose transport system permease subunit